MTSVDFTKSCVDHSVFTRQRDSSNVILMMYVDDILVTDSDSMDVEKTKQHMRKCFVIKDLGQLRYFVGIEIAHGKQGLILSQRKYEFTVGNRNVRC